MNRYNKLDTDESFSLEATQVNPPPLGTYQT